MSYCESGTRVLSPSLPPSRLTVTTTLSAVPRRRGAPKAAELKSGLEKPRPTAVIALRRTNCRLFMASPSISLEVRRADEEPRRAPELLRRQFAADVGKDLGADLGLQRPGEQRVGKEIDR